MLSDSCHDFLSSITAAAAKLQSDIEYYAEPPFSYSTEEISELRRACETVLSSDTDRPWKPDAMLSLVTAVYTTLKRNDAPWINDEDADDHPD
jgi:hypothetical protein